ncbi:MAG: PAS domain-containing protein, partial [Betaproteobacteria bacterium]|nr:PAS domain-containing protein [Betaproteobacteria bacterium]
MASFRRRLKPCFSSARIMLGKVAPSRATDDYCRLCFADTDSNISRGSFQGGSAQQPAPTRAVTWQKTHDLSQVIEQVPIGVAVTLADGTIEYANPHLRRLLDLGAAQTLGPDLAEFREAGGASLPETIRGLLLAGKSWQGETHFRTATGEARHVLESIYPLPECNRGVTRFIHFFQDFTALKLA